MCVNIDCHYRVSHPISWNWCEKISTRDFDVELLALYQWMCICSRKSSLSDLISVPTHWYILAVCMTIKGLVHHSSSAMHLDSTPDATAKWYISPSLTWWSIGVWQVQTLHHGLMAVTWPCLEAIWPKRSEITGCPDLLLVLKPLEWVWYSFSEDKHSWNNAMLLWCVQMLATSWCQRFSAWDHLGTQCLGNTCAPVMVLISHFEPLNLFCFLKRILQGHQILKILQLKAQGSQFCVDWGPVSSIPLL